jgi:hypothetical protein
MNQKIWEAKNNFRITLYTDGDKFIAQIQAGIEGETYLSVGYSCPNYAEVKDEHISVIADALQVEWDKTELLELDKMLPALYNLCQVANQVYNKLL